MMDANALLEVEENELDNSMKDELDAAGRPSTS